MECNISIQNRSNTGEQTAQTAQTSNIILSICKKTVFLFADEYIFSFVHVFQIVFFAEAGLLAQRALFMSNRLLGPSVAIGAIDLPAGDIFYFFFRFNDGKQPR